MTANVYPYPNDLPPGSQAFARETIKRIETLESNRNSADSDQNATNKITNLLRQRLKRGG